MNNDSHSVLTPLLTILGILVAIAAFICPVKKMLGAQSLMWLIVIGLLFFVAVALLCGNLAHLNQLTNKGRIGCGKLLKMPEDGFSALAKIDSEMESDKVLNFESYQPKDVIRQCFLEYKERVDALCLTFDLIVSLSKEYGIINTGAVVIAGEMAELLKPICDEFAEIEIKLENRPFGKADLIRCRASIKNRLHDLRVLNNKSA